MADEPSESSYYGFGSSNLPPRERQPTQDLGGRAQDFVLDTTRGALGIARDLGGIREAAATPEQRQQARADMDEMGKVDYWLQRARSPAGRYRAEHPEARTLTDEAQDVASGILPYAPLALAGPVGGAALFGGLAFGHQRVDIRDRLRDMPDEDLAKIPGQEGKDPQQIREDLYGAATDPTKWETWKNVAPAVLGNVAAGGALGLLTKGAMRTLSGTITDRVLSSVNQGTGLGAWAGRRAIGAATGGVGGAAMGGGGEYTREATEAAAGLRPQGVDMGQVWGAAKETGLTFGAIGALAHGRQPAPPVGTDIVSVARMNEEMPGDAGRPRSGREFDRSQIPLETEFGMPSGPAQVPEGLPRLPAGTTGDAARPMQQGDVYDPMGYQQPPGTEAQRWAPPPPAPPPAPLPPPGGPPGRRQMRQGDIMDELGPAGPRVVGRTINERPMVQGDVTGEYGFPGERMARRPVRGRPMEQGDLYGEYGPEAAVGARPPSPRTPTSWRPWEPGEREMTGADIGVPGEERGWGEPAGPGEPPGPRPFPPGGEFPTAAPKRPPRGGRGEGGAGEPPRGGGGTPPPRGGAGGRRAAAEAAFPTGEAEARAPRVSAAEFGGEHEAALPYPDRAAIRKRLASVSPETRAAWARRMADALDRGEHPLSAIPAMGQRMLGDHITRLIEDHPRGVIGEISRGVREVPREGAGLSTREHGTLRSLIEKATPEEREKWAKALESGEKYVWAKMPKSWKDAVKGVEKDINDLVTKNRRAVIDELRPREARYEEAPYEAEPMREAEAGDIGEHVERPPTPEGEARGEPAQREEVEAKEPYEVWAEAHPLPEPSGEYGPEVEGTKAFRQKRGVKARPGDLGLTRQGTIEKATARELLAGERRRAVERVRARAAAAAEPGERPPWVVDPRVRTRLSEAGREALAGAEARRQARAEAAAEAALLPRTTIEGYPRAPLLGEETLRQRATPEQLRELEARGIGGGRDLPPGEARIRERIFLQRQRGEMRGIHPEEGEPQWVPPQPRTREDRRLAREAGEREQRQIARRQQAEREEQTAVDAFRKWRAQEELRVQREERLNVIREVAGVHDFLKGLRRGWDRLLQLSPTVRRIAAAEAATAREQARKRARTNPDFQARERTLEQLLRDPQLHLEALPEDFFDDVPRQAGLRTMQQYLDELMESSRVKLRTLPLKLGESSQLPIDKLSSEQLAESAHRMIAVLRYYTSAGDFALDQLRDERYPPGSPRQPQIPFRLGSKTSGLYPWYDLLSDFNRRASAIDRARGTVAAGRGGVEQQQTLRNQMLSAYVRLKLVAEGKIEDVRELNRQTESFLMEDLQADTIKQQGIVDAYERGASNLRLLRRQIEEVGEHTKRGAQLAQRADELSKRLNRGTYEGAKDRMHVIAQMTQAMEEVQQASGRTLSEFTDAIHNWMDRGDIQDHQRMALLTFYQERFGRAENLPYHERVQMQREKARGSLDAYEQGLRDKQRAEAQIEGARQEIARQEAEKQPTPDEAHRTIQQNLSRIEELVTARSYVPDQLTDSNVRQTIDTLRYYLRSAERPMDMPREPAELTQQVENLTREIDEEINRLHDQTRRMYEIAQPDAVNWDYDTGRVLDPAADLRKRAPRPLTREERDWPHYEEEPSAMGPGQLARSIRDERLQEERQQEIDREARARKSWVPPRVQPRTEPPNLPRGAEVQTISDFLNGDNKRSIRPTENTPRAKLLNHFFDIADKVVGDADVVILTPEQYQLVKQARGLTGDNPAFYDQATHRIFTDNITANGPDRARILGHEFLHPLTVAAAERFPEITNRLDAVRKELYDAYLQPTGRIEGGEYRANDVKDMISNPQALRNVHEFISEMFNDDGGIFSALATMRTRPELRAELRTDQRQTLLGRTLDIIKNGIMKLFMQQNKNRLLNDAVIHSLDLFHSIEQAARGERIRPTAKAEVHPFTIEDTKEFAKGTIDRARYHWQQRGGRSGNFLRWHDLNQLGRRAEPGFRDVVSPFERLINQVYSTTRGIIERSGMPDMLKRLSVMSRLPAERWEEFTRYIDKENYAGLSGADPLVERNSAGERVGENKWVSEDAPGHKQMRDQHVELANDWQKLSPEMQAMRHELKDFSRRRHDELLTANINRMIDAKQLAKDDPAKQAAIRKHILEEPLSSSEEGKLDEAKQTKGFDNWVDTVRSIPAFKKLPGVWYPMFRRGRWVTEGIFNLAKHAKAVGGQEINRGEWQFDTAAERDAFLKRMEDDPAMKGVKLLRVRDVGYEKDPATGGLKLTDGKPTRAKRSDDTVTRYRAEYNPLLLEFHDSKFNAAKRHADIKAQYGNDIDMTHVEPVKDRNSTYLPETKATAAMEAMKRGLQRSEGWENMTDVERSQMTRDLDDAAIRHVMSNTARATYLPRKYALGADRDLIKNFLQYGNNTARTLAETMHHQEIRDQVQKLDKYVEEHKRSGSPGDPEGRYGTLRRQIQNQIHSVLAEHPDPNLAPMWKKALARTLQLSYIDRLVSPSFLLLNASEPWVLGLPLLAGHHGVFKSAREIGRAYNTVSALRLMAQGGKDFKSVLKNAITGEDMPLSDNLQPLRETIKNEPDAAQLNKLFDYADQHGYFDRNAGMELEQMFNPDANKLGRIADYTDQAFRQVNNQVENINRAVTAIASYRLGLQKGWSHEQSMAHAKDMMHDVNGNYAAHASPAIFRNQWAKPALQFKRYAHRITSNYLRIMATAFGRNVKGPDRAVALKQLGYWTAAQVAVSGALGLPTEPLKVVVDGLHLAGLINWNWDDVEFHARDAASDWLGPEAGMALMRGALRNAGLGIGTRLGHDSLWSYGSIENWKDVPGMIGSLVTGSPGSMAWGIGEGVTAGFRGLINKSQGFDSAADNDFGEFVEKAIPIKAVGDVYRATSQAIGGRKAVTKGGQPLGYDPNIVETGLAALGVRSAREQEASDFRQEFYTKERRYKAETTSLLNAFAMADTQAEKMRVMNYVTQTINPTLPPELKITVKQMVDADARRRQRGNQPGDMMGLPVNKRTRALLPRPDVYNVQ